MMGRMYRHGAMITTTQRYAFAAITRVTMMMMEIANTQISILVAAVLALKKKIPNARKHINRDKAR